IGVACDAAVQSEGMQVRKAGLEQRPSKVISASPVQQQGLRHEAAPVWPVRPAGVRLCPGEQ
ncbi:unnamed protein product, partial [Prorocentrum cordatum]